VQHIIKCQNSAIAHQSPCKLIKAYGFTGSNLSQPGGFVGSGLPSGHLGSGLLQGL
jgi:hypothetical protein